MSGVHIAEDPPQMTVGFPGRLEHRRAFEVLAPEPGGPFGVRQCPQIEANRAVFRLVNERRVPASAALAVQQGREYVQLGDYLTARFAQQ